MRKRILFRKTICSLLALLLSLSSLLVLPVLAADEEADAGDSVSRRLNPCPPPPSPPRRRNRHPEQKRAIPLTQQRL